MSWRTFNPAKSAARNIARLSAWLKNGGTVITASEMGCSEIYKGELDAKIK